MSGRTVKVGLLYPARDACSPANWSGTPRGLIDGLGECGVRVVPLGAGLPVGLREAVALLSRATVKNVAVANRTIIRRHARNWVLRRSIAAAGDLDGIIAMGTEMYDLGSVRPPGVPVATYDDATLKQMWRHPDFDIRNSGFTEPTVERWFRRQAELTRAATVCCVSTSWAARSFAEDYGIDEACISAVGMGHSPRAHIDPARRDWSQPRFLFVGVDWVRKNGAAVLREFKAVRKAVPSARLDIVGRHPDLHQPGVTGHGFLPRDDPRSQVLLDDLFAQATAFVLPSRFDPSPIAYLEAASAGLPVIATTEGGAGELLGAAAILVHPDNEEALGSALLKLIDPSVARRMGAEAAGQAAKSTWSHVAARILDCLGLGRS